MLAVVALHVVASSILLDTDMTFWTVLCVSTDVVSSLTVIGAFGEPSLDCLTVCRRVVVYTALETVTNKYTHLTLQIPTHTHTIIYTLILTDTYSLSSNPET